MSRPTTTRAHHGHWLRRFAVAVLACGAAWAQVPTSDEGERAAVRLLPLDTGRGPIHLSFDGAVIFADAAPGSLTPYAVVPAGASEVVVADAAVAAGEQADGPSSPTSLGTAELAPGSYATLLLLPDAAATSGSADDADGSEAFVMLTDPLAGLPPAGHAGLRLVHAVPGDDRLALVVRDVGRSGGTAPLFESSDDAASGHLARLDPLTAGPYATLRAGERALWLVREGGGAALAEPLDVPLRAGTLYTLYALPADDGDAVVGLLVIDATVPVPPERMAD